MMKGHVIASYGDLFAACRTKRAMGGAVAFQDALKARLDICKPSKKKVRNQLSHSIAVCEHILLDDMWCTYLSITVCVLLTDCRVQLKTFSRRSVDT